jgi:hypothetical protein
MMSQNPFLVYLDWNVVTDFIGGNKHDLLESLTVSVKTGKVVVPYTFSHLLEIGNITDAGDTARSELVENALGLLSSLSQNLYLSIEGESASIEKQPVRPTYQLVTALKPFLEIPFPEGETPDLSAVSDQRLKYGLDPSHLNNLAPSEVIEFVDSRLTSEENRKAYPDDPLVGQTVAEIFDQSSAAADLLISAFGGTASIGKDLVTIYTFIDALGYWPDKEARNSRRAQFIDMSHQNAAAFSDYYVSDDKRHRKKTKATYSFFGIKTNVVSSSEFGDTLKSNT